MLLILLTGGRRLGTFFGLRTSFTSAGWLLHNLFLDDLFFDDFLDDDLLVAMTKTFIAFGADVFLS